MVKAVWMVFSFLVCAYCAELPPPPKIPPIIPFGDGLLRVTNFTQLTKNRTDGAAVLVVYTAKWCAECRFYEEVTDSRFNHRSLESVTIKVPADNYLLMPNFLTF